MDKLIGLIVELAQNPYGISIIGIVCSEMVAVR